MKRLLLFGFLSVQLVYATAQSFDWVVYDTTAYYFNPDYATAHIALNSSGNAVRTLMTERVLNYGQQLFGHYKIQETNSVGQENWHFNIGPKAEITSLAVDPLGFTYVAGSFMDTLQLQNGDTLMVSTPIQYQRAVFILCIDQNGALVWKRNLSVGRPDLEELSVIAIDPSSQCWYGYVTFGASYLTQLDGAGQDVQTRVIFGSVRTIGGISFDPAGNMFVSGSAENGTVTVGGLVTALSEPYNMFVARYDTGGNGSWFIPVHDITFQSPRVVALPNGEVYFTGSLMDSASFGSVTLPQPQWVYTFFVTRISQTGVVQWAIGLPPQPTITGDFIIAKQHPLALTDQGGFYLLGITRGFIDWGNGVTSGMNGIPGDSYLSLVAFDGNGIPQWSLSGDATYFNPSTVVAFSGGGYIGSVMRGSSQFGSITVTQPSMYTFYTGLIRFSDPNTGVENEDIRRTVNVFPNPLSGNFLSFSEPPGEGEFSLIDLQGRVVYTRKLNAGETRLELPVGNGSYRLYFRGDNKSFNMPLIILR